MRAVLQRVAEASVRVNDDVVGQCASGLLILLCAMKGDTKANAQALADKIVKLRIFQDDTGRMNRSLQDVNGSVLIVSQFTLAADTSRGNRPGFAQAAAPDESLHLYEYFISLLRDKNIETQTGVFGANMQVTLINDGPVTISIDL